MMIIPSDSVPSPPVRLKQHLDPAREGGSSFMNAEPREMSQWEAVTLQLQLLFVSLV